MKRNFYPKTVIKSLGLLFISMLISAPFIFLREYIKISEQLFFNGFFVLYSTVIITISYFINKKRGIKFESDIKINNPKLIPLMISIILLYQIGISKPMLYLINSFNNEIPSLNNPMEMESLIFFIGAIVLSPILEEIIFRRIILKGFLTNYTPKKAILFSAIVFGVMHGEPIQIINAFIIGLFFGWIYYKTKSIGITIALHLTANLSVFILSLLYYKYADFNTVTIISIYIIPLSLILILHVTSKLIKSITPKLIEKEQIGN
jgi:membrane protease YdiL (CAAX protease family)